MSPPLTVRSGNRAAVPRKKTGAMAPRRDRMMKPPAHDWVHTRAALDLLEKRLLCSLCDCILQEPVCLGGCEHVFCRKCVGTCVGSECPKCHTPAWVKDVQINRQLANMIQLCSKLHDVLDGAQKPEEKKRVFTSVKGSQGLKAEAKKKQIRMWFSPRSGKVKCILNKAPQQEQTTVNGDATYQTACSTFAFLPSPPSEESPKRQKKPQKKPLPKTKKSKKKLLEDINKQWGFGKKVRGDSFTCNETQPQEERVVSFCSQPVEICQPEAVSVEEASIKLGLMTEPSPSQNGSVCHLQLSIQVNPLEKCPATEFTFAPDQDFLQVETALVGNGQKRGRNQSASLLALPASKRPQLEKSNTTSKLCSDSAEHSLTHSPERISLKNTHTTIAQISSPAAEELPGTPLQPKIRIAGHYKETGNLPKSPITSPGTPMSTVYSCAGSENFSPSRNLLSGKRNFKGETMLHVGSIKGDLLAVKELLKSGKDPNVKDHAGWTPLHEACNHGHEKVVELLLQHCALVNTTGYQNDSPLHDAVKNGHVPIVKLLLAHGASRDAVNIFGLRPADYAETEEMRSVLLLPSGNKESHLSCPSPVSVSMNQPREGPVVLMGSGLSFDQQKVLSKLAGLLKAGRCTEFNNTVTHIIVPDEGVLSTMKVMLGVLAGCWVMKFQWVQACLKSKLREPEEKYEIPGGPQRGRVNREHLLPKLLDGCYCFFMGWFRSHRKEDLAELVKAAGGQVLARQPKPDSDVTQTINTVAYHAEAGSDQSFCTQYIIYDKSSNHCPKPVRQGKVWTAPSSWLIDCITSFQLLPVTSESV